jgi:hypothetical protein
MADINDNDSNIIIIIVPNVREYFACELSAAEVSWLEKSHIAQAFKMATEMTEPLRIYNQSAEKESAYDLQNAILLFKKINIKITDLHAQNADLDQRLKKYTNGDNHKRYYEKNKDKIKETGTAYLQKLKTENPDKIKEYSHRAYLIQKEKKLKKIAEEAEIAETNARI